MLDMDRRIQPLRTAAFCVLALCLIAMGPWLGWWTLAPLAAAGIAFRLGESRVEQVAKPEYLLFAAWALSEVIIAVSVLLTSGGDVTGTIAWLALPITTLSARFSDRGTAIGVVFTMALLFAITVGADFGAVLADPVPLIATAALIVATAILSTALMQSDIEHRSESVLDPLTQLFNRKALGTRAEELQLQAAVTGEPVGVVVGDLDHFKHVNDTLGHPVGDAVLKDVAYIMRKQLRAFDLVYRIGGEEFLVLLPGADSEGAAEIAERLRAAIAQEPLGGGGPQVTMSFGVAASQRGEDFDMKAITAAADRALYVAKAEGRNVVRQDLERLAGDEFGYGSTHGVESVL